MYIFFNLERLGLKGRGLKRGFRADFQACRFFVQTFCADFSYRVPMYNFTFKNHYICIYSLIWKGWGLKAGV